MSNNNQDLLDHLKREGQSLPLGLFAVDDTGYIRYWDKKMEEMTGIRNDHAMSVNLLANDSDNLNWFGFQSKTRFKSILDDIKAGKFESFDWQIRGYKRPLTRLLVEHLGRYDADDAMNFFTASSSLRSMTTDGSVSSSYELLYKCYELNNLFASRGDNDEVFQRMLDDLIELTGSEYGFTGEIRHDSDQTPYLVSRALTNISWNDTTIQLYQTRPMIFRNLETLFGYGIKTGHVVIANEPSTDSRSAGLPPGHPPLDAFLGIPLSKGSEGMVGMIGMANRMGGYTQEQVDFLHPYLQVCSNIFAEVKAFRNLRFFRESSHRQFYNHELMQFITRRDSKGLAGIISLANERFIDDLGYETLAVHGHGMLDFFAPSSHGKISAIVQQLEMVINTASGTSTSDRRIKYSDTVTLLKRNGDEIETNITVSLEHNPSGDVTGLHVICRPLQETFSTRLTASREKFEKQWNELVDTANIGIIAVQLDGHIVEWSRNMVILTGRSHTEVLDTHYRDVILADDQPYMETAFSDMFSGKRQSISFEVTMIGKSQRQINILLTAVATRDHTGAITGIRALAQDITQYKAQMSAILQAQKMEAIGLMAGGLAHDLNNILTIIKGNLELLNDLCSGDADTLDMLGDAMSAAQEGYEVTRRLLAFGRNAPAKPREIPVNSLLSSFMKILKRSLSRNIEITFHPDNNETTIVADSNQLETALLNLVVNSRDAIRHDNGRIDITVRRSQLSGPGDHGTNLPTGDYVEIRVSDNGIGMSEKTRAMAINPYFTTKPPGTGTGFGLPTVHAFVKQTGGAMVIESKLNSGTSVILFIPVSQLSDPDLDISPIREEVETTRTAGSTSPFRKILIVDDNERVLKVVSNSIREWGFETETAENADQALRILARDRSIDLLLSDVVMHGSLSGRELANQVSSLYPDVRIILMTGYDPREVDLNDTNTLVLYKPYSRDQFFDALAELQARADTVKRDGS